MARILYEVAVLNEMTRNRDVTWKILPICTCHNCGIHPSYLYQADMPSSQEHEKPSSIYNASKDQFKIEKMPLAFGKSTNNSTTSFETAPTVSGYSSVGSQVTQYSDFVVFENDSDAWWKNQIIMKEETSSNGSVGLKEELSSDVFVSYDLQDVDQAAVNLCVGIAKNGQYISEISLVDEEISRTYSERNSGANEQNNLENEESKDGITKSFRDVLLGRRNPSSGNSSEEKSSRSSSYSDSSDFESSSGHMTNQSLSLSVPQPRRSTLREFQSHAVCKMVKPVEGDGQKNGVRIAENSEQNGAKNCLVGNSPPVPNGDTCHNGHCAENEQDLPYSTSSAETDCEIQSNTKSIVDTSESQNDIVIRKIGKTSTDESPSLDALVAGSKGKSKNKKKRQKLAAFFSPPVYQDALVGSGSLNMTAQKTISPESCDSNTTNSKSPPRGWDVDQNGEFQTDSKDFPSLRHENINRKNKQNKEIQISTNNNQTISHISVDSGLGTTHYGDTLNQTNQNQGAGRSNLTVDITEVKSETISGLCAHDSGSVVKDNSVQNINRKLILKEPPYKCKIDHGNHFKTFGEFISEWTRAIPGLWQTPENVDMILSISQRVVRLTVKKPYAPIDEHLGQKFKAENVGFYKEEQMTTHFGTGFCFYIGQDRIYIRTHSHLIRSPEEAKSTIVEFNIHDKRCNGIVTMESLGTEFDFETNPHSLSTTFTCALPTQLISYLHVFTSVPIVQKSNMFESDSNYFTDSCDESTNTGLDEDDSGQIVHKVSRTQNVWDINPLTHTDLSFNKLNTQPDLLNAPSNTCEIESNNKNQTELLLQSTDHSSTNLPKKPIIWNNVLGYSLPLSENEITEWKGYMGEYSSFSHTIKPQPHEDIETTRFVTPENMGLNTPLPTPETNKGYKRPLPVQDNFYGPFSCHAVDIVESSVNKPDPKEYQSVSPFVDGSSVWGYTSLIYAQNELRDEYNSFFRPNVLRHFDKYGKPCDAETKRSLFNPSISQNDDEDDLFDYDYDLLLIDKPSSTVEPSDALLDKLVDDIVSKNNTEKVKKNVPKALTPSEMCTHTAIMICYPHGGAKMVTGGSFDAKHFGGELYDVATCVGCIGAPLLSFTEDRKVYVTDILHNGTVEVNGRIRQYGLSHFHNHPYSYHQKVVYSD